MYFLCLKTMNNLALKKEHIFLKQTTDLAIIMLDEKGHITSWNKGAQMAKGYIEEEVLGKHYSVLYAKGDIEDRKPEIILQEAKQKGRFEEEGIRVRKDGSQYWAHIVVTSIKDEEDRLLGFANVSRDITAQRRVLTDLKNMKYALDQSSIVAITDRSGMIEYVNDKFIEISKYKREELVGKTHRVINSKYHSKEYMEQIWKTILSGKIWRGEIQNRAKDGSHYWVDTTITPLIDEYGVPTKFIAIRNDITKRKELERQKDDFIGIASHELKTPLTSLKGYVQLLHKRCDKYEDNSVMLFLGKIERQIDKINLLVQDLLDVTKIEAGRLTYYKEEFDINELAREIIDTMQYTTDKHAIVRRGQALHKTYGDRDRIGQVLVNLLSNAIKYSPQSRNIEVNIQSKDKIIEICVRDYGVGIPDESQSHIFDRFYRANGTKEKTFPGLGLGLYICAEIIKRHGGKIWFTSESGKGTSFYFSLPAVV